MSESAGQSTSPDRKYAFGDCVLDLDRGALLRKGEQLPLRPQAFAVLKVLVEHAGRLMTRTELQDLVWGRNAVADDSLSHCIVEIRRAIGDRRRRMIRTVPRKGYVFDMPVADHAEPDHDHKTYSPDTRLPRWAARVAASGVVIGLLAGAYWSATSESSVSTKRPGPAIAGSAAAEEQYRLGRFFYDRRGAGDLDLAEKYYRAALEADPRLAEAWAGLAAVVSIRMNTQEIPWDIGLIELERAVQTALALNPDLPEAQLRACRYYAAAAQAEIADTHCRRALELAPDDPLMLSVAAGEALKAGELARAIELQQRAVALDPQAAVFRTNLGHYLTYAGRFRDAEAEFVRAVELSPTSGVKLEQKRAFLQLHLGEHERALAMFEASPPGFDRDRGLAMVYHALARPGDADAALARLERQADWRSAVQLAEVYAFRGEYGMAMNRLARFTEVYKLGRCWCPQQRVDLKLSIFLEPVREHPGWSAVMADAR